MSSTAILPAIVVKAALAVLCGLLLLQAAPSPWQQGARRSAAQAPQLIQSEAPEPPDSASVAVCTIIKVTPDDPQWVNGDAEDLHEVRHLSTLSVERR